MLGRVHDEVRDAGPRRSVTGTERLCVATGEVKPLEEMIRFVASPDGAVMPDVKRRLPGRGIWITATRQALRTAVARKAFARSFKRDVRVPADLTEVTERLLERSALDAAGEFLLDLEVGGQASSGIDPLACTFRGRL